jgi:cell division protease FtsH
MSTIDNIDNILRDKYYLNKNTYNGLIQKIENHEVSKIYFTKQMDSVITKNVEVTGNKYKDYDITAINPLVTNTLADKSVTNKVEAIFLQNPPQNDIQILAGDALGFITNYFIPFLFISSLISAFTRFQQGGMPGPTGQMFNMPGMNDIDKDKMLVQKANISLSSFAGSPEIFEECTEVVSYLKNGTLYQAAGAEIPKGVLLEGPPGTGKTLLAKAIASEADANFISVAASEFVELFVGMGASKIRGLFKRARDNSPCIIFIDEIDAVGRQRGTGINMANDEREQTLNQLLAEMDGFNDNEGILVIAATNRRDVLDQALLRPGRFDRIINVPYPDKESRKQIFKVHSKNKLLSPNVNKDLIAELTSGFSGAQIKNLLNEAAILSAREGNKVITETHVLNALDKLIVGIVKKVDTRDDESRKRVSIHETGHALLAAIFNEYFDLKKATIQSTYNGAGGYTIFNEYQNITESGLYTKDLLYKRLIISMGGKAAENLYYGDIFVSVGAVQDLKQAHSLAQKMIGNFGMGTRLETFYNENVDSERSPFLGRSIGAGDKYSDETKRVFDKETMELVQNAYIDAKRILSDNERYMNQIVDTLLKNTTLTGDEIRNILKSDIIV